MKLNEPLLSNISDERPRKSEGGYLFIPKKFRKRTFLKWLRRTHAWLGLWGAVLGLLFGTTGFLMNHRATMKIPAAQVQESTVQLALPSPAPKSANELAEWLDQELSFDGREPRIRVEKSKNVAWGDQSVRQPERWQINLATPKQTIQAEYWVGNNMVSVKRSENNIWATLNKFHTASGVNAAWILLTDTLAGGLIVLALTGFLLWSRLHGRRLLALGLVGGCVTLATTFAIQVL